MHQLLILLGSMMLGLLFSLAFLLLLSVFARIFTGQGAAWETTAHLYWRLWGEARALARLKQKAAERAIYYRYQE